jgi:hypothetical protein
MNTLLKITFQRKNKTGVVKFPKMFRATGLWNPVVPSLWTYYCYHLLDNMHNVAMPAGGEIAFCSWTVLPCGSEYLLLTVVAGSCYTPLSVWWLLDVISLSNAINMGLPLLSVGSQGYVHKGQQLVTHWTSSSADGDKKITEPSNILFYRHCVRDTTHAMAKILARTLIKNPHLSWELFIKRHSGS